MSGTITDRVLAMAGIVQACRCVQQIARHGMTDAEALTASINSLFVTEAETTEAVYGGREKLLPGLRLAEKLFDNKQDAESVEVMRYCLMVIQLERSLMKKPAMLAQVGDGIDNARSQAEHFSTTHSNVLANLAGLYTDTLSELNPRIMVNGDQVHIGNSENVNRIRSLLLAAVRSAVLWRQKGGTRLQLIFTRKRYLNEIKRIIGELG
ncbi:high frequency lysogenization protein HflD [Sulfuriflexus sp.]|uniref:high frequency lysogenization protein HflD n=1 Tax=Sulfuriflexus sp. TaxID=2015443 RepID=UPI0028CE813A|nr:high frequency lysogenization protein HflD [Sulfuriflexus sp.]MDT8404948.1 high frequency lysogenization protein HflD [Sulfuriflexus sp.]